MAGKGFTLLELAIVLAIAGILAAAGIQMVYSALDASKYSATRNQLQSVIKDIAQSSAEAQKIPADSGELAQVTSPVTDAFGTALNYVPAANLTSAGSICSASSTPLTVETCPDSACSSPGGIYSNIALFVSSNGGNKVKETDDSSGTIKVFTDKGQSDDMADWMTLAALKEYAGCSGNSLGIIEKQLPDAYTSSVYSYALHPKGGVPPYSWCAESSDSKVRTDMFYGAHNIKTPGSCSEHEDESVTDLDLSSNSVPLNYTDSDQPYSKIRVYVKDSEEKEVYKDYVFRVVLPNEMVMKDSGSPDDVSDFGGFETADPEAGDGGGTNPTVNPALVTDVSPDQITIQSSGSTSGAACVWYAGRDGLSFWGKYAVSYFEYSSNISNYFEGFTFALIKNIRPPVSDPGSTDESTYVSTENDCGDNGSGMGYSYSGSSPTDLMADALYGNGFAVEFDPLRNTEKNDPFRIQGHSEKGVEHVGIVSALNGYSYNVHGNADDAGSQNDICTASAGGGCYEYPDLFKSRKSVRVEAYSKCNSDGTLCNTDTGRYICVYTWIRDEVAADSEMRDTSKGYMNEGGIIPFGLPDIHDCYEIPDGSMDRVRPGFTFSNLGSGTTLDFYHYGFKSNDY